METASTDWGSPQPSELDTRPDFAVSIDLFNGVEVGIFHSRAGMRGWFRDRELFSDAHFLGGTNASAHYVHDPDGVAWFVAYIPKDTPTWKIAHECLHLAWMIFEEFGVEADYENHEHLAYTMDMLMRQILEEMETGE